MFTRLFGLALILGVGVLMTSCGDDVYYQGGNAEIQRDYITLRYDAWMPNASFDYQWYQEFLLDGWNLSENGMIVAYQQNIDGEWEPFGATTVGWNENGVVYSEEFWYSFANNGSVLAFHFRNTHPDLATPPAVDIPVKLFIVDDYVYSTIEEEGVDFNDIDQFTSAVEAADFDIREVDFELKK
jgi:hypothetical protein